MGLGFAAFLVKILLFWDFFGSTYTPLPLLLHLGAAKRRFKKIIRHVNGVSFKGMTLAEHKVSSLLVGSERYHNRSSKLLEENVLTYQFYSKILFVFFRYTFKTQQMYMLIIIWYVENLLSSSTILNIRPVLSSFFNFENVTRKPCYVRADLKVIYYG